MSESTVFLWRESGGDSCGPCVSFNTAKSPRGWFCMVKATHVTLHQHDARDPSQRPVHAERGGHTSYHQTHPVIDKQLQLHFLKGNYVSCIDIFLKMTNVFRISPKFLFSRERDGHHARLTKAPFKKCTMATVHLGPMYCQSHGTRVVLKHVDYLTNSIQSEL